MSSVSDFELLKKIQEITKGDAVLCPAVILSNTEAESKRIVEVRPLDDEVEMDADLQGADDGTTGVLLVPSVGSQVIIAKLSEERAIVIKYTKLDKILVESLQLDINKGLNGGLIKIQALTKELEKEKKRLSTLLSAIEKAPITPSDGGASFKTALVSAVKGLVEADYSEIENTKVRH